MSSRAHRAAGAALVALVACAGVSTSGQTKYGKSGMDYSRGVFFETDGSLPNGVCFRISGRVTSGDFFHGLERVDTANGTIFRRGSETVTSFPDSVSVSFSVRDLLCSDGVQPVGTRTHMTQKMMDELRLSIYWKHGVELQPVKNVKEVDSRVDRIYPYATTLASELSPRYEWTYQLAVTSSGVPITDSLAFVFRAPDGHMAARVAARL